MKPRGKIDPTRPPPDLQVLRGEDGEVVIVSFALPRAWPSALSLVESAVVALVLQGHSNEEIASLRGTSPRTVANQIASAFRKLGVRSRLELVAYGAIVLAQEK